MEGRLMADRGRHEESLEFFERAAELDPGSTIYLNNLATALARLEQFSEAGDVFTRVYELDNSYPGAAYFAAASYSMAGRTVDAGQWMELCLERRLATYEQFETADFFETLRNSADWRERIAP